MKLNSDFWNNRYVNNEIGWDIGQISAPIKEYLDKISPSQIKILIPGAGNAYEAEYAHSIGLKNTHVVDISIEAIRSFQKRVPDFSKENIHHQDFFDHEGQYDLIVEQTFFCALDPSLRSNYVKQMSQLLKSSGKLVGVLFNKEFGKDHPPFGGTDTIYKELFSKCFDIHVMEPCHNSIKPRLGSELWVEMSLL